jgi:hypothetical protein
MKTKRAQRIKALLKRYSNLLTQMHGELQRLRLRIQPERPMKEWSIQAKNFVWTEEPDETAEQLLEAEYHCLEAGEGVRELLRTKRFKLIV